GARDSARRVAGRDRPVACATFIEGCQLRRQFTTITTSGIEEDQQHRLAVELRQRLALVRQVRQIERRRFSAERQACRLLTFTEFELIQAFLQLLEPQEQATVLA